MSGEEKKEKPVQAAARQDDARPVGEELERIFQEHHNRVIQTAYRVTGNASDAEDVLQNVFLRLIRGGRPPNTSENLGSYLHRAAVNASIDVLRSRKPGKRIPLDDVQHWLREDEASAPDQARFADELREWLRSSMAQLSAQSAEIFALRYLEDFSNQEIAEQVGTSPGVVAVVLHRCRNRLKDQIRTFFGEPS